MKLIPLFVISVAAVALQARAEAPAGYYSSCENKGAQALLTALCDKIGPHTNVGYDGLWNVYRTSDVRPDGSLWDIYTDKHWSSSFKKCGNYKNIGDCVNREHSLPKSWFSEGSPMKSDAFHVYPTDGKVNGQRSNHPYGECANGTRLPDNNSVHALGRLGSSTFSGYSGTVFEPDDQYKGDLARTYFYMVAAYNDRISGWTTGRTNMGGNSYPGLNEWSVRLFLKWHRQDPVDDKERTRNDAVYRHQHNRNPFIDHPEMVEYIWGDKKDQKWSSTAATLPALTLPVDGSTLSLGATIAGTPRTAALTVSGTDLTEAVTLTCAGEAFSVSPSTLTAAQAQKGASVTVTFAPERQGDFTGTLTVASGTLRSTVRLTGKAQTDIPVGPVNSISSQAFVATWAYVGDDDANGCYTLDVTHGGTNISGYPRQVNARAAAYTVMGLEPATQYAYTVSSQHLTSAALSVTTAGLEPLVAFLYDGEPQLEALAGEASQAAELLVEIENIDTEVHVAVSAPFQISTDKADWATSLDLDPEEDRLYLRVNAAEPGSYSTTITATAGTYFNDDAEFSAIVSSPAGNFTEDFEKPGTGSYSDHSYDGRMCRWDFSNAGMWRGDKTHTGDGAVRMGKNTDSAITMAEDCPTGLGTVTLWTAIYGSDPQATYTLEYSTDHGTTWTPAGTATVEASTAFRSQTFTVNAAGPARLRLRQTAGKRFMVDDIEATPCLSGADDTVAADPIHSWDAYARRGHIIVETSQPATVSIYALDGTVISRRTQSAGQTMSVAAPAGLYIVAVGDYSRRVLVK